MKLLVATLLGKVIASFSKFLNIGGGSAAPGLYALLIEPNLIEKLSARIAKNVVITGTNGKTTTAKMLAHFAKSAGLNVIRNHTGSNLERGIASALLSCRQKTYDLGIWELDEAAFNTVAPKLKPDILVFLNVFRDQLDRYGEFDTVVKKWCQALIDIPARTQVLVNGDDGNTNKLAACFKGKVQKFGIKDYKIKGESIKHSTKKENLDFEAQDIKVKDLDGSAFQLKIENYKLKINLPLPGIYHIYDFLAAFAAGIALNLNPEQMAGSVKTYSPAFGRVEKLPFGYIFLIKNPAGATQVFETITPNTKPADHLLLALNDNIADGKDVSWIWDAEFEKLKIENLKLKITCSGTRAYDLALRLKYAGFKTKALTIQPDISKALKQAVTSLTGKLFILPTYTAMLELQSILTKSGIKRHYWMEEE